MPTRSTEALPSPGDTSLRAGHGPDGPGHLQAVTGDASINTIHLLRWREMLGSDRVDRLINANIYDAQQLGCGGNRHEQTTKLFLTNTITYAAWRALSSRVNRWRGSSSKGHGCSPLALGCRAHGASRAAERKKKAWY